jgi:predicted nuclease with TOPRIM domain
VTIAKAAETDRLTDENRRLRAKVEDSEAKVHALAKDLAERDSEIAKLQLKNANLQYKLDEHRAVAATPAPDYVTRAELVKVLRETAFTGIAADFLEGLVFAP